MIKKYIKKLMLTSKLKKKHSRGKKKAVSFSRMKENPKQHTFCEIHQKNKK